MTHKVKSIVLKILHDLALSHLSSFISCHSPPPLLCPSPTDLHPYDGQAHTGSLRLVFLLPRILFQTTTWYLPKCHLYYTFSSYTNHYLTLHICCLAVLLNSKFHHSGQFCLSHSVLFSVPRMMAGT